MSLKYLIFIHCNFAYQLQKVASLAVDAKNYTSSSLRNREYPTQIREIADVTVGSPFKEMAEKIDE